MWTCKWMTVISLRFHGKLADEAEFKPACLSFHSWVLRFRSSSHSNLLHVCPGSPLYTMSNTHIRKSALRWMMGGNEVRMCRGEPRELAHESASACLLPCSMGSPCHRLFYLHLASEPNKASILFSLRTLRN